MHHGNTTDFVHYYYYNVTKKMLYYALPFLRIEKIAKKKTNKQTKVEK